MSILSTIVGAVCPPAGIVMNVLDSAKTAAGNVIDWITSNITHLLIAALACSLAWGCLGWHEKSVSERRAAKELANWPVAFSGERAAFQSVLTSNGVLLAAIRNENASVDHLARDSAKHQEAASKALTAAKSRAVTLQALAAQLRASAAQTPPSAPDCHTPQNVMDARDKL